MAASNPELPEQPLLAHLIELRDRMLRIVLVVLAVFVALFPFANDLYTLLAEPLMAHLPSGSSMIATEVASPFLTPFKLTLIAAIFIGIPVILYQFWAFIAPGLYQHERRMIFPLVISSTFLFYAGMAFAYFVVFPLVFGFLVSVAPEGVSVMTDISKYLDFVLKLFFAFGVAFEVPIATILLVWMGATTPEKLIAKRPYIIVGAFVVGMLLTPPDVISQSLLAIPVWLLFEVGVVFSRFFVRKPDADEDADESQEASPSSTATGTTAAAATVADDVSMEELEREFDVHEDALEKSRLEREASAKRAQESSDAENAAETSDTTESKNTDEAEATETKNTPETPTELDPQARDFEQDMSAEQRAALDDEMALMDGSLDDEDDAATTSDATPPKP
jgi:sec-independent protein translocase protein TatC